MPLSRRQESNESIFGKHVFTVGADLKFLSDIAIIDDQFKNKYEIEADIELVRIFNFRPSNLSWNFSRESLTGRAKSGSRSTMTAMW